MMMVALSLCRSNDVNSRKTIYDIKTLSESIENNGLLCSLVVTPNESGFTVVCGERRFRALMHLVERGVISPDLEIPCRVVEGSDIEISLLNLAENVCRQEVPPWELGQTYVDLMDRGITQVAIAKRLGVSRSLVTKYARLAKGLHPDVIKKLSKMKDGAPGSEKLTSLIKLKDELGRADSKKQLEKLDKMVNGASPKREGRALKTRFRQLKNMVYEERAHPYVVAVIDYLEGHSKRFLYAAKRREG